MEAGKGRRDDVKIEGGRKGRREEGMNELIDGRTDGLTD